MLRQELSEHVDYSQTLPIQTEQKADRDHESLIHPESKEGVLACCEYLLTMATDAELRDRHGAEVIVMADPILDVFHHNVSTKPNREGGIEYRIPPTRPDFNLGGGANVLRGLAPFAKRVTGVIRVGTAGQFPGVLEQELSKLPGNVSLNVIPDTENSDAVKIRYCDNTGKVIGGAATGEASMSSAVQRGVVEALAKVAQEPTNGNTSIIASDYGRGLIDGPIMEALGAIAGQKPGIRFIIDPRPSEGDREKDNKFNVHGGIPTPNRQEAEQLTGMEIRGESPEHVANAARVAAAVILQRFDRLAGVVITCDSDGAHYVSRTGEHEQTYGTVASEYVQNPSGAGDIVVATLALLPDTFSMHDKLQTAMYLAGTSVTYPDTSTLSPALVDEVRVRLELELQLDKYTRQQQDPFQTDIFVA